MFAQNALNQTKLTVPSNFVIYRYSERRLIFGLFFIFWIALFFQQRKATDDEQYAKEYYPYFGRKKKGAYGHCAEDKQHKTYIFCLFIYIKTFLFAKIIVHRIAPWLIL